MKTIGICATKGGTGKTTVATALAVHLGNRSKVALLDLDYGQESAGSWLTARARSKLNGPDLIKPGHLPVTLSRIGRKYDFAFLDCPPTLDHEKLIDKAVQASDYIISPVRPSMLDVTAAETIANLADDYDVPIGFVFTDATEGWASTNRHALGLLADADVHVFKARLTHRQSYVSAMVDGRTAAEIDKVARDEVAALWEEILSWMM